MLERVQPSEVVRGVRPNTVERVLADDVRASSRLTPSRPMAMAPRSAAAHEHEADARVSTSPATSPGWSSGDLLERRPRGISGK